MAFISDPIQLPEGDAEDLWFKMGKIVSNNDTLLKEICLAAITLKMEGMSNLTPIWKHWLKVKTIISCY